MSFFSKWFKKDSEPFEGTILEKLYKSDPQTTILSSVESTEDKKWYEKLFGTGQGSLINELISYLHSKSGGALTGAQREQNIFNAEQAAIDRGWQERMSNTAYQRGVVDMQAAGLNPALMYGSGSAAVTPSGAVASGSSPSSPAFSLMSLLMESRLREKEIKSQKEIADNNNKTAIDVAEINAGVGEHGNIIREKEVANNYDIALRKLSLEEYLTTAQVDEINAKISDFQSQISSREISSMLDKAKIMLTHAQTYEIRSLVPAKIGLMSSEAANLDADSALKSEEQFIKHGLLERGYIDKQIEQIDLSIEGLKLSNAERDAVTRLKNRLYDVKTGKPFYENSGDLFKDVPAKVLNEVFGGVVQAVDAVGSAIIGSLAK